uniref:ANK_REP_REGION domain-containing protein n=1 Tax=Steinernema glaseri TaxID=37863 RepID=A0A1I7YMT0_9BILA
MYLFVDICGVAPLPMGMPFANDDAAGGRSNRPVAPCTVFPLRACVLIYDASKTLLFTARGIGTRRTLLFTSRYSSPYTPPLHYGPTVRVDGVAVVLGAPLPNQNSGMSQPEGTPAGQQQPAAAPPADSQKSENSASFLRAARAGNLDKVLELLRSGTDINTCNANGLNALHLASKEGHSEVVRELLKRRAIVDAATKKGNTALHIASLAGQELIVTILVENGADVNVQSLTGFTPLYMAAQENHEGVVRYLLAHRANQALATEDGFTPLAVALQQGHDRIVALLLENDTRGKVRLPALHIAAKKDDIKAAALLLQNEHNADVTSKSGFTPLHIAAHYGNEAVAQLLLEKGANVNYQARHNISPLHVATKWGRGNMAILLLAHGAIIDCRTRDLLTPLHCAARSGHDQVVDILLEKGAPISAKTKNGLAPLHMAAQGDHVDSARILLYHRAAVDDVTVDYLTPLHVAAHCGHVRVAKLLLDRNADPNARALNGFTPLHIACKKNRIKVVELLLKYHAAIEATTESGLSPLHVASFMGAINIVIYLLQQGANVDVATVRGETPLHLAARANQTDIVRVLTRNGAKVDAQARELQTPLHIASRLGNTDIVSWLLQSGANPNAATRDQYTPLHIAAKEGQDEVATTLLEHGSDKALLTKKGFTPLHLASKYGNLQVAKILLDRKTPVDIEGKNQVTPLHVAAHYNNDKIALLLLENGASAHAAAKNGYTALHIAAKKNQMEIAGTLLQYKADPNAESKAGFTPLHLSAQEGHREMAALLIEHGSQVNAQAKNGLTPMHLCAQEDRVNVAEELVKEHATIDSKTKAGYTPLHVACHFGQVRMVQFLVEHGAPVSATTKANYTPLHQAAQQGHNNCVRYLIEKGASPDVYTSTGQTPLSIAQRLGYVSVVETLKTVTQTTVITETTTVTEERYAPQNPEAMNETMFSDSEDEGEDNQVTANAHVKDFSESLTQGLQDSTGVHLIHTGEQMLSRSADMDTTDADLDALIKQAQHEPVATAVVDSSILDNTVTDNIIHTHNVSQPSKLLHKNFLISFLVDARGGAMRGCRHSGVRIIIPPRKAAQPTRITCRYLRKDKLAHPPPLSEGESLASRILEMGPHGAKFLGPVILEVPHFASLRGREREIVILRSDDGQHWKEHQLEATEDAVQEVLNESFDAAELAQLDDLHTPRITRILTNDFPMYFAVVTRVRQEVHCVGPEGGVILSSVVPRVQAIFPDGSLTKIIKVSLQAQPIPHDIVARLHGNRVAVSPIVTVEPRRRKFHKPITLCIPLPQSSQKGMLTQYSGQPGQEPPTLRLLCSITGGSSPAQWEDITGTTQLTFTGEEVSFTTTVSARFWLMDCQTPRDAARMAQEVYNEAISVPYMAKFVVFARRMFPTEGQLRVFCMTDDKEDKTLEKQEHFIEIARSRDVEVLSGRHQFLEFSGNMVPITKSGDQLQVYFLPFQENRLAFNIKVRPRDDEDASATGRIAMMKEPKIRAETLPPQQPICTLAITLPEYAQMDTDVGAYPDLRVVVASKYSTALESSPEELQAAAAAAEGKIPEEDLPVDLVARKIGPDWARLARALQVPDKDIRAIKQQLVGKEPISVLKIWIFLKKTEANRNNLENALKRIGRDDIVRSMNKRDSDEEGESSLKRFDASNVSVSSTDRLARIKPSEAPHAVNGSAAPAPVALDAVAGPHTSTHDVAAEPEESVKTIRTVVKKERHVHDTGSGPVVEERTITTTYEDDIPVNEEIRDETVSLTEEETEKWNEMVAEMNQQEGPSTIESEPSPEAESPVSVKEREEIVLPEIPSPLIEEPEEEAQEEPEEKYETEHIEHGDGSETDVIKYETRREEGDGSIVTETRVITTTTSHKIADEEAEYPEQAFDEAEEDAAKAHEVETIHGEAMSSQPGSALVLSGLSSAGVPLVQGLVFVPQEERSVETIPAPGFHHVGSFKDFQAEEWSGEHDEEHAEQGPQEAPEAEHHDDEHEAIDEDVPVASSAQFERTRSDSLAAALLETTPSETKPFVGFVQPIEEENGSQEEKPIEFLRAPLLAEPSSGNISPAALDCNKVAEMPTAPLAADNPPTTVNTSLLLSSILIGLSHLQMTSPEKYTAAVNRLQELEQELKQAGAICPQDAQLSASVAQALAAASPNADVQIRVSTSRKTTTTNTSYETETPGMCGLDPEQVSRLHKEMLANLTAQHGITSATPETDQKVETMDEGFTNEDGSVVVSKKMTRVVTTTKSSYPDDQQKAHHGDELIRLKVNDQVYDGTIDPFDHQIHLVPIVQTPAIREPQQL